MVNVKPEGLHSLNRWISRTTAQLPRFVGCQLRLVALVLLRWNLCDIHSQVAVRPLEQQRHRKQIFRVKQMGGLPCLLRVPVRPLRDNEIVLLLLPVVAGKKSDTQAPVAKLPLRDRPGR